MKGRCEITKTIGNSRIIVAFAWLLFILSGLYSAKILAPIRNEFFMVVAAVLIVGLTSEKPLLRLENKFWHFMGKISYDVFVIHIMVLLAISRTYQCIGITDVSLTISIVTYILATVITIILAWLCNKYVEEPFSKIKK